MTTREFYVHHNERVDYDGLSITMSARLTPITTFRISRLYDDGGMMFVEDSPTPRGSFYTNVGPTDMSQYRIGDLYDLVPRPKE
jgi:hypothetical protein